MRNDNPELSRQRMHSLLRIVLLVFGGQIAILYALEFLFSSGSSVFGTFMLSRDFVYYHNGARAWLAGGNPYQVLGFVTPPLSLLIPALLGHMSLARAAYVFLCCNLVVVPLALWWYAAALRLPVRERLLFLLSAVLFVSAHECVRGGNMDGLMLALLIAAFSVRRKLFGAFWLAVSIVLKFYSVIFLPIVLRRRQWRFAALTAVAALILLLPFYHLWPSALHALAGRNARYLQMSIAPATLVYAIRGEVSRVGSGVCFAFWATTFAIALYRDHERELGPRTLARYVPWMLALPSLVFSYVGVLALAVLASLIATARERTLSWAERCCFVGFLLLGIHVEHVSNLLPISTEAYLFFRNHAAVVQSFGVVMMMVGICLSPREKEYQGEQFHEAGQETAVAGHAL